RAAEIARPPTLDDASQGRTGIEPQGQLRRLKAHHKLRAACPTLVGQEEHRLRGDVHTAVSDKSAIPTPHATAESYQTPHFAAAIGGQMAASRPRERGRKQAE